MKPKANVRMLHDQILVMPISTKPKSEAGLIVVIEDKTVPIQGIVLASGVGKTDKKGKIIPMPVEPGDRVVFIRSDSKEIKVEKDTLLVITSDDVLCKVTNA